MPSQSGIQMPQVPPQAFGILLSTLYTPGRVSRPGRPVEATKL